MIGIYVPAASAGITGLVKLMMLGGVGGAASGIGGRAVMTAVSGDWSNWQEEIFSFRRIATDFAFGAAGSAIGFGARELSNKIKLQPLSRPANVPNPNGRLGGTAHQTEVQKIIDYLQNNGIEYRTEYKVHTYGGFKSYRYVDVVAFDEFGNPSVFYQIGKLTKGNLPVMRERKAIIDLFEYSGLHVPISFIPYW